MSIQIFIGFLYLAILVFQTIESFGHVQKAKKKKDASYTVAQYQKFKEFRKNKNPIVH